MIALNCGAIPESLLESELFGFERGAFTGADRPRQGKIELADRGTLFLDEVGEMNPKTQIELLRVLECRELRRLGGSKTIAIDIRVIAATNKILSDEVAAGRFREDLFYRLNVVPIRVPALRERTEDIPILTNRFLQEFGSGYNRTPKRLTREAGELLLRHRWPGNVRELKNLMERLTVTVNDTVVQVEDMPDEYRPAVRSTATISVVLGDTLEKVEEIVIRRTLAELTSHRERAAAILGISPRALHYKLRRIGLGDGEGHGGEDGEQPKAPERPCVNRQCMLIQKMLPPRNEFLPTRFRFPSAVVSSDASSSQTPPWSHRMTGCSHGCAKRHTSLNRATFCKA
jgi:transcriptional regulator with PAS, ATPase and Fis domain